ncbi:MAG: gamma-glutamylcyclotransferase [Opitutales bacterium]
MTTHPPNSTDGLIVFVYGTLQPGGHYWADYCEGKVRTWRPEGLASEQHTKIAWPARVRGQLFHLKAGYPALVADATKWAHGCLLCLKDAAALRGFDRLEDYDPYRRPELNEYNRHAVEAYESPGERSLGLVWTYFMQAEVARRLGAEALKAGRWPLPESKTAIDMAHRSAAQQG